MQEHTETNEQKSTRTPSGGSVMIAEVARTSRAKGRENDAKVARWVYQYGHTTDDILRRLLDVLYPVAYKMSVDKSDKSDKKVKGKGLIQPVSLPAGYPRTFVLTELGVRQAHKVWDRESLKYPWPRSQLSRGDILHCHDCQNVAIIWNRGNSEVYYEREFKDGAAGALPDLIIKRLVGDKRITEWHEIERNGKSGDRLLFQIQERVEALIEKRFDRLVWHFDSRSDEIAVRKVLNNDSIPYIVKTQNSFLRDMSRPGVNPRLLERVCEFYQIDDEVARFDKNRSLMKNAMINNARKKLLMERGCSVADVDDAIEVEDLTAKMRRAGCDDDEIAKAIAGRNLRLEQQRAKALAEVELL